MKLPQIVFNKSRLDVNSSNALWIIMFVVCILMAFVKEIIFPAKYFGDSYAIEDLINRPDNYLGDISYGNTAKLYSTLGLTDRYFVLPILGVFLFLFLLIKILKDNTKATINILSFITISFFSVMAMVYLTTFSKDMLTLLFISYSFYFLYKRFKYGIFVWGIFIALYATFFRSYWVIIGVLFYFFYFFLQKTSSFMLFFVTLLLIFLSLSIAFHYKLSMDINSIRSTLNEDRVGEADAQTAINPIIKSTNILAEGIDVFIAFIFLSFPIPLLLKLSPYYIIIFFFVSFMFFYFWKAFTFQYEKKQNTDLIKVISFLLSVLIVQSIFEPDYGSYVKHLSPIYPFLFLLIINQNNKVKFHNFKRFS